MAIDTVFYPDNIQMHVSIKIEGKKKVKKIILVHSRFIAPVIIA